MKSWNSLLLLTGVLLAFGCSSSSTGPEGGEQIFTGQVAYQNPDPEFHTFIMSDTGIVRIEIDQLVPETPGDIPLPEGYVLSLGFALGLPFEGQCRATYQSTVVEGSEFSFQLVPDEYCLLVVDTGALIEGMTVDYVITLTGDS